MIRKTLVILGTFGGAILFFGLIIVGMGAMRPQPEKQEASIAPPTVFWQPAEAQSLNLAVYAQGEVDPKTEIALTAQVGGEVVAIAPDFADGGTISRGDMLVQVEQEDYRLAVIQAEARVAQAEQSLKLEQAEAALAERDWEELGGLESGGEPSALTLRQPQLNQARANFAAAEADLRNARLALQRTTIRAPFDGRVRETMADVGQYISPGFTVARLFSTDVAEIRLPLDDNDLARLELPLAFEATAENPGPRVFLSASVAGQIREWEGRIVRTDAAIDPSTRQISAIVEVRDPYGRGADDGFPLAMGLFVDARIEGRELDNAYVVPRIAMQDESTVFVVSEDDTVVARNVAVTASLSEGMVITDGLSTGDRVVVSRVSGLESGDAVNPISMSDRDRPTTPRRQTGEANDDGQASAAGETGSDTNAGAQL